MKIKTSFIYRKMKLRSWVRWSKALPSHEATIPGSASLGFFFCFGSLVSHLSHIPCLSLLELLKFNYFVNYQFNFRYNIFLESTLLIWINGDHILNLSLQKYIERYERKNCRINLIKWRILIFYLKKTQQTN